MLAQTAAAVLLSASVAAPQPQPADAIATIVNAFQTHRVVALEEPHGDARAHAFRVSLVRDPRFARVASDILVEFGNSRFQDTIDRFVDGAAVAHDNLKKVWQNTTQSHAIWDRPIYEDFFRVVRAVNAGLPKERRLRVLLGDPPIDWDAIHSTDDLKKAPRDRGRHPQGVLEKEVLAKGRRALVIYGALHLLRQNLAGANLIERVETSGTPVFIVASASFEAMGIDPASLPVPSVTLTAGTNLSSQLDAVLYLGPSSGRTTSRLTRALCADAAYREMRSRRMALSGEVKAAAMLTAECNALQTNPDFSGVWKPVDGGTPPPKLPPPPPGIPPPPPPPKTLSLTITHTPTTLTLTRKADAAGREVEFTASFKLDGTESVNQMGPVVRRSKAAWQDGSLVINTTASADGSVLGEIQEVYRLVNGDLVIDTTRKTPAGTFTGRTVNRKQ
jgi:hypothetical protein